MSREERKVVTVLFTDLVGFTSRAEELDPEDVRAMLTPYYARLREQIEQRGGGDLSQLEPARAFFDAERAAPFLRRCEAVLAASA